MDRLAAASRFHRAGRRAARYLATMQRPHGGVTGDDLPMDVFHKLLYAFEVSGRPAAGHRLARWILDTRGFNEDGAVNFYLEPVRMAIYKHAWLVQGAQRLGRFELSGPAFDFLLRARKPCGGFACETPDEPRARALTTGWGGVAALAMNRLDIARDAGEAMIALLDAQPEPGRFYFYTSPEGELLREPSDASSAEGLYGVQIVVDTEKPAQFYWEIGMGTILLSRLYQTTGEARWLSYARKYLTLNLACQPDGFSHPAAGKSGMGAALLHGVCGDDDALRAAVRQGDFLARTQERSGAWALPPADDSFVTRLDQAGEFCVWLCEAAAWLHAAPLG